ncbi:hypothetical protein NDU88_007159 [Pleurodeles waltl]|uniref:Uncharacterized protein n=1 Tax=Pleurodeles waltl TaxID=8319 RepID=A0AAV7RP98_PLEWA|nr:hypothetical protein NDU88_007159 [Pleurodeles waltl]
MIIGTDYEDFVPLLTKASKEYPTNTWWEDAPYGSADVEETTIRPKLSRKQKRQQRQSHQAKPKADPTRPAYQPAAVLAAAGSFRQAQREDPTLKKHLPSCISPG